MLVHSAPGIPPWKLPSASPPCLKLETWLRMAAIPYNADRTIDGFTKSPKGKIPFIIDEGKIVGDSTLIVEYLQRKRGIDLDKGLSAQERATSVAFRRMIKENMYWHIARIRFYGDNWLIYRQGYALLFPEGTGEDIWGPIADQAGENTRNQMYQHGIGRHSDEEHTEIAKIDLQSLSVSLGDKKYFFGDRPTTLDATAYAYVASIIRPPFPHPINTFTQSLTNLMEHCDRIQAQFFPEMKP